jgi:hypothetical protein
MRHPHRHRGLNEGRGNSAAIPCPGSWGRTGLSRRTYLSSNALAVLLPTDSLRTTVQTKKPFVGRLPTKGLGGYKTLLYRNERSSAWLSVTRKTCTDSLSIQIGFFAKVGSIIIRN